MSEVMDKLKRQLTGEEKVATPALSPPDDDAWMDRELQKIRKFQMWQPVLTGTGGRQPEAGSTRTEEKLGIDLGSIFKAMAEQTTEAWKQLAQMTAKNPQAAADPYVQHLEGELKDIKQTLQNAGSDPLESLTSSFERMKLLSQTLRDHLGIPNSAPATGISDIVSQIQLEEVRQRTIQMQHQHEKEMALLRRGFEKEDKRWEEEFSLKRLEFVENKRMRGKAGDLAEDLIGGLLDSFKPAGEGEEGIFAGGKSSKPRCPECGATLKITDPDTIEVICQVCGTELERPKGTE